jgi:hypothetical protein
MAFRRCQKVISSCASTMSGVDNVDSASPCWSCLPSLADCPPSGSEWLHEIKHDGFRLLACRDAAGIRLLTRSGNDFTARYPLIV